MPNPERVILTKQKRAQHCCAPTKSNMIYRRKEQNVTVPLQKASYLRRLTSTTPSSTIAPPISEMAVGASPSQAQAMNIASTGMIVK